MKCDFCNTEMYLDDTDELNKGNKDLYWVCPICNSMAFEMIRHYKSIKVDWCKGDK